MTARCSWFSGAAFAPLVFRSHLAYVHSVWVNLIIELLGLLLTFFFWRAVYTGDPTIAGFTFAQTLNLMLWARILTPLLTTSNGTEHIGLSYFGRLARDGELATELLRPVDFQWAAFTKSLGKLAFELLLRVPLGVLALAAFGLNLPPGPLNVLAFAVTALLGYVTVFLLDWILSCLAFHTTATWGLSMVRWGVAAFLGGALLPLEWLPAALQGVALHSPFALALYQPVRVLLDLTPPAGAAWLVAQQLLWIAALLPASRWVFRQVLTRVSIQGG